MMNVINWVEICAALSIPQPSYMTDKYPNAAISAAFFINPLLCIIIVIKTLDMIIL